MDHEFFVQKIKQLTDEKLKELIQLKTKGNREIIELAEKEAALRGIDLATIEPRVVEEREKIKTKDDKGINWMWHIAEFFDGLS